MRDDKQAHQPHTATRTSSSSCLDSCLWGVTLLIKSSLIILVPLPKETHDTKTNKTFRHHVVLYLFLRCFFLSVFWCLSASSITLFQDETTTTVVVTLLVLVVVSVPSQVFCCTSRLNRASSCADCCLIIHTTLLHPVIFSLARRVGHTVLNSISTS